MSGSSSSSTAVAAVGGSARGGGKRRGSWRRAGCECFDVNKRCFGYKPQNFRSGLLRFAMHEEGG